ncbi:MAG: class I SAM-dependent methyltransferase [Candidatus Zixiibacteriota bacterium]
MSGDRNNEYDSFAWFYHKFWEGWPSKILPILDQQFFPLMTQGGRILDLCCGTGAVARHFVERGYAVVGVDGSEAMLEYARLAVPSATFICSDARNFKVNQLCDGAVSLYDSLNHIMTLEGLTSAFACTRKALKPGAVFFFDMNDDASFAAHWRGSQGMADDESAVVAKGSYDADSKHGKLALTMFRFSDNRWERTNLVLEQHAFSAEEINSALDVAGFGHVRIFNTYRDFGWGAPGRLVMTCRARG